MTAFDEDGVIPSNCVRAAGSHAQWRPEYHAMHHSRHVLCTVYNMQHHGSVPADTTFRLHPPTSDNITPLTSCDFFMGHENEIGAALLEGSILADEAHDARRDGSLRGGTSPQMEPPPFLLQLAGT